MAKRPRGIPHRDPAFDAPAPPRAEVARVIDQLLSGQITREAATLWADQFLGEYQDEVLQEGLELLQMTDHRDFGDSDEGPYMFGFEDLEKIRGCLYARHGEP